MEIELITIKEYAKNKNVSYEAVRKQLQKYKGEEELKNHIIKKKNTQYLDTYAVEFLDKRRRENAVILIQSDKDEELNRLTNENKTLLLKVAELQNELLKEKDQVKVLQNEKIELLEERHKESEKKKWQFWR